MLIGAQVLFETTAGRLGAMKTMARSLVVLPIFLFWSSFAAGTATAQAGPKALQQAFSDAGFREYSLMWPVRNGSNDWVGRILRASDKLVPPAARPDECFNNIEENVRSDDVTPFSGYLSFQEGERFLGAGGGLLRNALGLSAREAKSKYVILTFTPGKEENISAEGIRRAIERGVLSESCRNMLRKKPVIVGIVRPGSFAITVVGRLDSTQRLDFQEGTLQTQALINLYSRRAKVEAGALVVETPYCIGYKAMKLSDLGVSLLPE
jgi:hypothetical protein